ncbi:acyl-CoA dehydrogenase family protein [Dactylosporangium sp. AC04546]|uniref:acyl-CoA dehydrogenase family protein n=1 Tax=Dactylosporangium sp. AC04546 TaxID=2862460 RepID=UPI001EDEEED9|nr:acyl-CoA dehydrogenase family protein [Dactylosporangium sp. AC04546]WVK81320.1 acyl-CoA dehydrogenase family protein [Dactylosporangium sp. AC04546]
MNRLAVLRAQTREWAAELRPHALEVDRDPDAVVRHLGLPALSRVARLQIPPQYNPDPLVLDGHRFYLDSAAERVVFLEELAWGDLGLTLAAPGGAMAGVLVGALGSPAQQDWFFDRLLSGPGGPTWTCFALTEAGRGSDATGMRTTLTTRGDGTLVLDGGKRYVGNAVRARLGVTFARTGTGPLGFAAVLIEPGGPGSPGGPGRPGMRGITAEPVPTIGLRGAQLGALTYDGVEVPPERVLGRHLPASRRGMWGWVRTFNLLRPSVAAMGLGIARAAYEYVLDHRPADERLDRIGRRIAAVRRLTARAAEAVDRDPGDGHLASAAKVRAARLVEDVTRECLDRLGPGAVFDHPLLEKLARDARGIEFMEGAGNVQRLAVFGALQRGQLALEPA